MTEETAAIPTAKSLESSTGFSTEQENPKTTEQFDDLVQKTKHAKTPVPSGTVKKTTRSKKRRRAAPKSKELEGEGEDLPPKPFEFFDRELMKMVAGMIPFAVLAWAMKAPEYLLTEAEKDYMAKYWDAVLMKHLPDVLEKYGEESMLFGAIGVLIIQKSEVLKVKTDDTGK
jgi:hypothetical protein